MTDQQHYQAAKDRAEDARMRFLDAVSVAQTRVSPTRLKSDAQAMVVEALHTVATQTRATAWRHPFLLSAIAAAIAGWVFRRPIAALSRRLFVMGREKYRDRQAGKDTLARQHSEDET